jgi:hypothetical protein
MDDYPPLSINPRGKEIVVSMWIEFAITTLVLVARLYTRVFLVRKAGWDDYLMVVAFVRSLHESIA